MPIVTVPPPAAPAEPATAARQARARAPVRTEKVRRTVSLLARVDPRGPTRLPAGFPGRKAERGVDSHKEGLPPRRFVRPRLLQAAGRSGIVQGPPLGDCACALCDDLWLQLQLINGGWEWRAS